MPQIKEWEKSSGKKKLDEIETRNLPDTEYKKKSYNNA